MAIQFIPLIAAIVGGAATVGAGAYAYKSYQDSQNVEQPVALIEPAKTPEKIEVPKPEPVIVEPELPVFHVLTVETDGSVVIAGAAQEKSIVDILHNQKVLAKAKAASNGDFAIFFKEPLEPGTYELFIRSTLGESVLLSAEAGIIKIPERGDDVVAMVTKSGEASRLIQIPTPNPKPVQTAVVTPDPVVQEPVKPVKPEKIVEVPKPVPVKPVLLGAVEVERDKIFVAGSGEPDRLVNIYIDEQFVGQAQINKQGTFLLETNSDLKIGKHIVRADMLAAGDATVVARAEVPLIHDAPVVEPPKIVVANVPKPTRNLGAVEIETPAPVVAKEAEVVEEPVRVIRTSSSVIIRKGDNLWRVSRRILGRGIRYSTIYDANRGQIKDPNLIFPGQIFKVPEKMAGNSDVKEG